jgi:hypothetical protein
MEMEKAPETEQVRAQKTRKKKAKEKEVVKG